jgi:hypothetical protein
VRIDGQAVFENPAITRRVCLIRESLDGVEHGESVKNALSLAAYLRPSWDGDYAAAAPPWYALFIGVYVMNDVLPMYVAQGVTRREFSIQAVIFALIYAAVVATLMTVGFVLESVLYRVMDWPHDLTERHLYASADDVPLIFVESWLQFPVWLGVGAFIAVARYRFDAAGLLTIAPALLPIALVDIAVDSYTGPADALFDRFVDPASLPLLASVALCLAAFLLVAAMTWPIVRDVPLRTKAA